MTRLIPPLTPAQKEAFVAHCRTLLTARKGKPVRFKHGGRSIKGIDCVGTPAWGYAALGLGALVQDLDRYSRRPDGHTLRDKLIQHLGQPIKFSQAVGGDIALMRWFGKGARWVNHVAVITPYQFGGLGLLHAYADEQSQCVVEHRIDGQWQRRIVEVYRT